MNHFAVDISSGQPATAQARLKMLEGSMRCFEFGLLGLLPLIGLPFALAALRVSGSVRRREKYMWNPARFYRVCGVICGAIASVVWIFSLILAFTGFLSYLLRSN